MVRKIVLLSFLSMGVLSGEHESAIAASLPKKVSVRHVRPLKPSEKKERIKSLKMLKARYHSAHIIQCVTYVRMASDFTIRGNAREWWGKAAGLYERGKTPEPGAVLSFKPVRKMRLGHVALVDAVIDSRTITISQAHWASNGISHGMKVMDISAHNDWSAVRVQLPNRDGSYGSVYPTNGFIYSRKLIKEDNISERINLAKNKSG